MSIVDQVLADARAELLSSVADVIDSINNKTPSASKLLEDLHSELKNCVTRTPRLHVVRRRLDAEILIQDFLKDGNKITLVSTQDVVNLISHLFSTDELLRLGFESIRTMSMQHRHGSHKPAEASPTQRHINIYLLRPTITDAKILKANIQYEKRNFFPVMCLPDVYDMFPQLLQRVLGESFTVGSREDGNNLVHLFPCNIHMAPIEPSVLSMFLTGSLKDFLADGDPMVSWFFAKSIEYLECRILRGAISTVTWLGQLSKLVCEAMIRGRRDCAANLTVLGLDTAVQPSDLSFMSQGLRAQNEHNKATSSDEANHTVIDQEVIKEWKQMMGVSSLLNEAVVMDRLLDMVTPLCLNFTYEGLLDNIFGIEQRQVRLPPGILEGHSNAPLSTHEQYRNNLLMNRNEFNEVTTEVMPLTSTFYKEIRWLCYADAAKYLHQRALQIHKGYDHGELNTIGEMSDFVKRFKILQKEHSELNSHVNLMSWISSLIKGDIIQLLHQLEDFILHSSSDVKSEDYKLSSITAKLFNKPEDPGISMFLDVIYANADIKQVYRLLMLLSQTRGGIREDNLKNIKRVIADQYGFEQLMTIQLFEDMGLIGVNNNPDTIRWSRLCKKLNLLVDRETSSSDYSVFFGGYAPMSMRLLQLILVTQSISTIKSELSLLNSPIGVLRQKSLLKCDPKKNCSYMLFGLIGGITLGEIAAVASMNQKRSQQILVLTTNVINMQNIVNATF